MEDNRFVLSTRLNISTEILFAKLCIFFHFLLIKLKQKLIDLFQIMLNY